MKTMNNNFCILGSFKTGTSTMVGILNCHPDIFCHFEYKMDGKLKKRHLILPELSRGYLWVGDKNPKLGSIEETDRRIERYIDSNIVFCYRNIENWLCHRSIIKLFGTDEDVVGPTVKYLYYLIKSFDFPNVIRIKLEDLLFQTEVVTDELADFFEVDRHYFNNWWDKVGKWQDKNKRTYRWWEGHNCSMKKPTVDIAVNIKQHSFWDIVLPIVDNPQNFLDFDVKSIYSMGKIRLEDVIESWSHKKISSGKEVIYTRIPG